MSKLNPTDRPHRRLAVAAGGVAALALAGAGQAVAEDVNDERPPTRYAMPGAVLRVLPSYFDAANNTAFTLSVTQTRRTGRRSTLSITLPAAWRERAPEGGPMRAAMPIAGTGSSSRVRVRRVGRVVRFSFTNGRRNDSGRYTVTDRNLAPATYPARFDWRVDGYRAAYGTLSVLVLPDLTP